MTDSTFCGGPGTVIDITTAIEGVTGGASIVCEGNSLKKCSLVCKYCGAPSSSEWEE